MIICYFENIIMYLKYQIKKIMEDKKHQIYLDFDLNSENPLVLPEKVEVPLYTIIEWTISSMVNLEDFIRGNPKFRSGLSLTVYFETESPFEWKKESLKIIGDPLYYSFLSKTSKEYFFKIADGIAEKKGEFKYGLKASQLGEDEPEYDVDPIIIVGKS